MNMHSFNLFSSGGVALTVVIAGTVLRLFKRIVGDRGNKWGLSVCSLWHTYCYSNNHANTHGTLPVLASTMPTFWHGLCTSNNHANLVSRGQQDNSHVQENSHAQDNSHDVKKSEKNDMEGVDKPGFCPIFTVEG